MAYCGKESIYCRWQCDAPACWILEPEYNWVNVLPDVPCTGPAHLQGREWSTITQSDLCCHSQSTYKWACKFHVFIDREAGEIIRLVASVRTSGRL